MYDDVFDENAISLLEPYGTFGGGNAFGRSSNTSSKTVCHYYLKGNCRFGNNCKFAHPSGAGGGSGK